MAADDPGTELWRALQPSSGGVLAAAVAAAGLVWFGIRLAFSAGELHRQLEANNETVRANTEVMKALQAKLDAHSDRLARIEARLPD